MFFEKAKVVIYIRFAGNSYPLFNVAYESNAIYDVLITSGSTMFCDFFFKVTAYAGPLLFFGKYTTSV